MATTTTKLALTKPDLTDARDIRVLNTNFDTIDKALTGDSNGHLLITVAGTTSAAFGTLGTTPSGLTLTGNDTRGKIVFTTGSALAANATAITVTFANAFTTAPAAVHIGAGSVGAASASQSGHFYISSISTTTFVIGSNASTVSSTAYTLYYIVVG